MRKADIAPNKGKSAKLSGSSNRITVTSNYKNPSIRRPAIPTIQNACNKSVAKRKIQLQSVKAAVGATNSEFVPFTSEFKDRNTANVFDEVRYRKKICTR